MRHDACMNKLCRCWLPAIQLSSAHQPGVGVGCRCSHPTLHCTLQDTARTMQPYKCCVWAVGISIASDGGNRRMHAARRGAELHPEPWRSGVSTCSHSHTHLQPWRCNAIVGVVRWNISVLEALQKFDHLGHQGLIPCSRAPTPHTGCRDAQACWWLNMTGLLMALFAG